ncbi:MAG: cell division protein CrgA [Acidimicrobiales bacterium]
MARPTKPKAGGRVTPKSTGRYTPPVPQTHKVSSKWIPAIMFTALGLGMLTILANYVDLLPGDGPNNSYLLIGLGLITVGFVTATRYH